MSTQSIIALVAVLPLIGALICRLDDATGPARAHPASWVNLLMICGAGWVAFEVVQLPPSAPPSALAWSMVASGWVWICVTWVVRESERAAQLIDLGER